MAVFGTPVAHEDDALRAVRAAGEMRERLGVLNDEFEQSFGLRLAARTGVNTGEVVAGDPATSQTLVLGDAVNIAARLEQAAEPGEILLGEETYLLVRDAVRAEPLEPLALKGKAGAVVAFRLLEVLAEPYGVARRFDTPLVGRARELAQVRRAELGSVGAPERELAKLAGRRLASAGQRTFRRGDMSAAAALLERAAALLPPLDPERVELLPDLRLARFGVGQLEKAGAALSEAIEPRAKLRGS